MASELSVSEQVQRSLFARTLFGRPEMGSMVEEIAAVMRDLHVPKNGMIYRQGEASTHIYFIVEGQVALDAPGESTWTFGPKDGFGFQDAMRELPHARSARALTDVHLLAFSAEDWFDLLEDHGELGRGAILRHSDGVRRMVAELAPDGGFPEPGQCLVPDIKSRPNLVERIVFLSEASLYARAGIQALATLARTATPVLAPAGHAIVAAGARTDGFHLVGAGIVELRREAPALLARFGPGAIAGGLSSIGRDTADSTLVAVTDSILLHFREDDWFEVIDDHFDLARAVFAYMAGERELLMREVARRTEPAGKGR